MNHRSVRTIVLILGVGTLAMPGAVFSKDAPKDAPGAMGKPDTDAKPGSSKTPAEAKPRVLLYRGQKASAGGTQPTTLMFDDIFTGKSETAAIPPADAAAKKYEPMEAIASTVKDMPVGTPVTIETERQKGRVMVTAIAKADYKPGEEQPDGFVYVENKEEQTRAGAQVLVTLSKFGKEVVVGIPNTKGGKSQDQKSQPDPKIDGVVRRLEGNTVVFATFKPGKPPMLASIFQWRPPEKGKFVGLKETTFNEWPAAGFEIVGSDGTKITFVLEGAPQSRNGKQVYIPDPKVLKEIQQVKPDTEVEVLYRLDGRSWMYHKLTVLNAPTAKGKGGKSTDDTDSMKPEKTESDAGGKMKEEKPKTGGKADAPVPQ